MNRQKVLIIGKKIAVVTDLAEKLKQHGYAAAGSHNTDWIQSELRHEQYDLLAFGQGIKPEVKQRLEMMFRLNNPDIIVITGLYPSVPVLFEQIILALSNKQLKTRPVSHIYYDINEGCLTVRLMAEKPCKADIDLYRMGFLSKTYEYSLLSENIRQGEYAVDFEEKALSGFGAKFMVIRIDRQTCYMQRL